MAVLIVALIVVLVIIFWSASPVAKNKQRNSQEETGASNTNDVRAAHLRVPGEIRALCIGILAIAVMFFVLLRVTFGAVLLLVAVSVVGLKIRQGQLLGQSVRVNRYQLPKVFEAARVAASRVSTPLPDVFVTQNPVINAYALGFFGRTSIVLHSATVEAMDADELCYVIGHELTHIKCGHVYWLVFTNLKDAFQLPIISGLLGFLLRGWSRKAEYTSDRGGLVACRNLRASISALAKLTVGQTLAKQLNLDELSGQKEEADADTIARISEAFSDHPYVANRVFALHGFSETEYYKSLPVPGDVPTE